MNQIEPGTLIILPALYGLRVVDMEKIFLYPDWFIETDEEFQKSTQRTKIDILGANGKISLSIPVKKHGKGTPTSAIKIDYIQKWQNQHWRSIQSAYGRSPFFEYYEQELKYFFHQKPELLVDFTVPILKWIHNQYHPKGLFSVTLSQTEFNLQPQTELHLSYERDKTNEKQRWNYTQVFGQEFVTELSVLDALFCAGPNFGNHKSG